MYRGIIESSFLEINVVKPVLTIQAITEAVQDSVNEILRLSMMVRNQLLAMPTGMSVMRWDATGISASCATGLRTTMQSE
jgi:hypothetical protein